MKGAADGLRPGPGPARRWSCVLPAILSHLAVALHPGASAAEGVIEGGVALGSIRTTAIKVVRVPGLDPKRVSPPESPVAGVWVEVPPGTAVTGSGSGSGSPKPGRVEQRNFQFSPNLLVVQKGTSVAFPNEDGEYHSVFSYSKTKRFDLGRFRQGEEPPAVIFDQAGVVRLFCEIHKHMRGVILVVDSPWFTRTTTNGTFRLEGVPAGDQRVKVWLEENQIREKVVTVRAGETTRVEFP